MVKFIIIIIVIIIVTICCRKTAVCKGDQLLDFSVRLALTRECFRIRNVLQ